MTPAGYMQIVAALKRKEEAIIVPNIIQIIKPEMPNHIFLRLIPINNGNKPQSEPVKAPNNILITQYIVSLYSSIK